MARDDDIHDEQSNNPPPLPPTQQTSHTVSSIKLFILKKGEYDIWAMKMKHYLGHTDYHIWEDIQKGNGHVQVTTDANGQIKVLPPKTAKEILARERERKARTTLLMAILEDHLAKFHKMTNAKAMWEAIKSRFGGNDESKKMQKYILKQQFEGFSVDEFDLEEMDLKWQVAMIFMRLKKFYKKTGRKLQFDVKELVSFDKTKVKCFKCHNTWYFVKECKSKGNQESKRRYERNTGYKARDNGRRPAKQDEPKALVTIDGDIVDWTGHADDDIEDYALMAFTYNNSGSDIEVTSCSKECEESYAKLKKLYDEQMEQLGDASIEIKAYTLALQKMSAKDRSGLGYGDQIPEGGLSYENEVLKSVFDMRDSGVEDSPVYDRFAKVEGMNAVLPPMIGNCMPSKFDFGLDELNFTYGPKQSKTCESDHKTSNFDTCTSNSSVETLESVPKLVESEPKVDSQPKVWSDAPIIEEYESDSDNKYVFQARKEQEKPSFAFVNTFKHVKTPRETGKEQNTHSQSPKVDRKDWNGQMSKKLGLGHGFTKKTCFICGIFSHLIRDCDFHEKIMAKHVELNKKTGKGTGQGEKRTVWNNMQSVNYQNKFVPRAILLKFGRYPVNTGRQHFSSQVASTSTARKVNTARPIVNETRPKSNFYKSLSPIRMPFNRTTTPKANFTNHKGTKQLVLLGAKRKLLLRPQQDDPQKALKDKGIVDSGCSRHITGNKAYLGEYQDYNGGLVAFGGSKGRITGKGKIRTGKLDFKDVYFVKELQHFNLFSVSQMCDKKNKVLFTDTECLVLSLDFMLPDENQILLRVPRQNNMYNFNLKNIVPAREFKNREMIDFYGSKGIKKEYSNARTPQQNGVAERKNRSLIKAARTMLADLFLPITFWVEAVSIACYVLKRVLVTKPQNKTPYELLTGKIPIISYIRPFGCHVTILNTIDHMGKFDGKSDAGFLAGYSLNSKAFRAYNLETQKVEENLHPVTAENQANKTAGLKEANDSAGTQANIDAGDSERETKPAEDYFVLAFLSSYSTTIKSSGEKPKNDTGSKPNKKPVDDAEQAFRDELARHKKQEKEASDAAENLGMEFAQYIKDLLLKEGAARVTSTNHVNTGSSPVNTGSPLLNTASPSGTCSAGGPSFSYPDLSKYVDQDDSHIPPLVDIYDNPSSGVFTSASYDDEGAVADFTNLESTMNVSPIPTSRIRFIHPTTQILGDPKLVVQTRSKVNKSSNAHAFVSYIQKQRRNNHKDFQHYLFACFLSQIEPKKISQALEDESCVDAMQEEMLNKKDERGVVVRNKARLVAQGYMQEEGVDYDEVFALVARIEAIKIFLASASYMSFIVYQIDVKSEGYVISTNTQEMDREISTENH
uniref:Integrase catalytic domain-containing protein n=1 Tax=Tanacetum cinerariifolium TaxID=118510 RepID=A0A699IB41_TANCI|nr:hypothetical protein [Tanacetum cinerariifolium]